jgi:hypothetical protein
MRAHEIEVSRSITLVLFWFNLVKRLTPYFIGCIIGGITSGAIFRLTDSDVALKIVVFTEIALVIILIPVRFLLWQAYKRNMADISNNIEVRNSVADFLVNKITAHRCGHEKFYVETLIKLGDSRIIYCLEKLLKSIFSGRRQYAIRMLGKLGGEKAIELLKAAIDDKNYDVSEEAKKAYSKLTEEASN